MWGRCKRTLSEYVQKVLVVSSRLKDRKSQNVQQWVIKRIKFARSATEGFRFYRPGNVKLWSTQYKNKLFYIYQICILCSLATLVWSIAAQNRYRAVKGISLYPTCFQSTLVDGQSEYLHVRNIPLHGSISQFKDVDRHSLYHLLWCSSVCLHFLPDISVAMTVLLSTTVPA